MIFVSFYQNRRPGLGGGGRIIIRRRKIKRKGVRVTMGEIIERDM